MSEFVHLHLHSEYSLLDGCLRINELARTAVERGFKAVALTDHGATYGLVPFYQEMKRVGVHPVLGCEVYLEPPVGESPYHLVLLAENNRGYQNLLRLVTMANLDNFYSKPLVKREWLAEQSEGLIGLSGCLRGEIPRKILTGDLEGAERALLTMRSSFARDCFFLEVQRHGIPQEEQIVKACVDMGRKFHVGLAASNDVHYLNSGDARTHDLLLAVQTLTTLAQENRMRLATPEYYLKPAAEMKALFADLPEAIGNTGLIAERCQVELELGKLKIPYFPVPDGFTAESYLRVLCEEGFRRKFPEEPREARQRLEFELQVINGMRLAGYFLIVWDLVRFARKEKIPVGPGRGSAVGSLVVYLLGITDINPLDFGLIFERFLNPERIGMPDIDIDLCHRGRPKVLRYIRQKYGRDQVAHLAAYITLKPRATVRDVGRALGVAYETVDKVAKAIPYFSSTLEKALEESALFRSYQEEPGVKEILTAAGPIAGLPRHITQHAAGVVIADGPLTNYLALQRAGKEEIVTQGDMETVEELGLVKIDLLGLRYLTVIDQTINWLNREGNPVTLETIPLDDPKIFAAISAGKTIGTFQLESGGMRRLLARYQPENLQDLVAIIALFRPGPLGSGVVETFIKRRFGKEPVTYLHPGLTEVLADTYGTILYQEQIMQAAQILAGYTLGEADVLRKAIAKRNPAVLAGQRETFETRAKARGIPEEVATRIFEQINEFGHYGFPKGHAVAYAYTSYRSVYLKTYFPRHYHAALLSLNWGVEDRFRQYLSEARYLGIKLLGPDINRSEPFFTPETEGIRAGLVMVRDLGERGIRGILEERSKNGPFLSIMDFSRRMRDSSLSLKAVQNLIKAGAFDSFGLNRPQLLGMLYCYWKGLPRHDPRQMSLFGTELVPDETVAELWLPDYDERTKFELEREILGHYLTKNPLDDYRERFNSWNVRQSNEIKEDLTIDKANLCGFLSGVRAHRTKRGERMYFATLEDLTGLVDLVFFPAAVAKCGQALMERRPLLVKGRVDRTEETATVIVEEVRSL